LSDTAVNEIPRATLPRASWTDKIRAAVMCQRIAIVCPKCHEEKCVCDQDMEVDRRSRIRVMRSLRGKAMTAMFIGAVVDIAMRYMMGHG
jgi:hypothetical protein